MEKEKIPIESLYKSIEKELDKGKEIIFRRQWTGVHVIGKRRFSNVNYTITADSRELFNRDYQSDRHDIDAIDEQFNELKDKVYELLMDKALEFLAKELNFRDVDEMEHKAEVFYDDYGNPIVRLDDKEFTAIICPDIAIRSYAGIHTEAVHYHEPELLRIR